MQIKAGNAWLMTIGGIVVINLLIYFYEIGAGIVESSVKIIKRCDKKLPD
jgi:hypothetical protein